MLQKDIISGYKKLIEMNDIKMPASISFKLYKFKKQLKECFDWQLEEERKLFEQYNVRIEDNSFVLEDTNKTQEFVNALNDIGNTEHEDINKLEVSVSVFDSLSFDDLDALSNIFEIIE